MRTFRLSIMCPAIMALAGGAALADSRAETTTYVDGNLTNVSPNSGGTLTSDDKAIHLRTGLENLDVPYTNVSHAELGAVIENSHDVPFYKIWAHKRSKTQTQYLIVNFKNDEGAEKTMTLELAQPAAAGILEAIEQGSGKTFEPATSTATAPVAAAQARAENSGARSGEGGTEARATETAKHGRDHEERQEYVQRVVGRRHVEDHEQRRQME